MHQRAFLTTSDYSNCWVGISAGIDERKGVSATSSALWEADFCGLSRQKDRGRSRANEHKLVDIVLSIFSAYRSHVLNGHVAILNNRTMRCWRGFCVSS